MMRAVDIRNGAGTADDLFITDKATKPQPKPGDALVKVKAFGLNRMDIIQRGGNYPLPPQAPKTLGVEFSGTIEAFGPSKECQFNVGDEVFGLAYGGAYAEYIAVSTKMLIHKPSSLTWVQAAGIPETWITATQALHRVGQFAKGQTVLWHAGASSVSIAGIQLSKLAGASAIYATAGSAEKCDFCVKTLGATAAFNYKSQNWVDEIEKATEGKGVDLIIDFVGQNYFQGNIDSAAMDGKMVLLGTLSGSKLEAGLDMRKLLYRRIRVEGSTLRSRDVEYQKVLRDMVEDNVMPGFADGTLSMHVSRVFPWEEIVDAHKLMESNQTTGKIVCIVEEESKV